MGVFNMPSLGADMEAGKLVEWLVQPGDTVKRGDVVAVVETQKGAIEIEIFEEGTVGRLEAELGMELPVGAPLAVILGEGEAAPADVEAASEPAPAPAPKQPLAPVTANAPIAPAPPAPSPVKPPSHPHVGAFVASPAARVRAHELGVDLASLKGSGPGGVIVLSDVEGTGDNAASESKRMVTGSPMQEMRKAIAAAMTRSKQTIPHLYLSHTIDIQRTIDWLAARNEGSTPDERLLLGAVFVRVAALAAAKAKDLNGHYLADGFHPSQTVNPGVAVALRGGGLVAPALMDAPAMTLDQTMVAMRDLVTRARAGRLRSSEMTEGTLTVTALGEAGPEEMIGVIFPPQVAIVGLGAPQMRPWVIDGKVVPRTVVTLCVSADHRVVDGRKVARFITAFETLIQAPEEL